MGLGTGLTKQEKVIWAQVSLTLCFLTVDVSDKLTLAPTAMSSQLSPCLPQYDERIPLNCKSALTLAPLTCFCQVVYDSNTANSMKTLAVISPPTSTPSSFSPTTGSNFIQKATWKKICFLERKHDIVWWEYTRTEGWIMVYSFWFMVTGQRTSASSVFSL